MTFDAACSLPRARPIDRLLVDAAMLFHGLLSARWGSPHFIHTMTAPMQEAASSASPETLRRFQATILPHLDSAYNFARFLSRDTEASNDIVQEAFLRAFRAFETYRGGDARAWIFAIVRNCHHAWQNDRRRKARLEVPIAEGDDDGDDPVHHIAASTDTPEASAIRHSESARVRRVIAALPEMMREILILREIEEFSYRQISEVLDIPLGTVMSRLARARREFSDAWHALEAREAIR